MFRHRCGSLIACLAVAGAASDAPAQSLTIVRERVLASRGAVVPRAHRLFPLQPGVGTVFTQAVGEPGATRFRIHFVVRQRPGALTWAVRVLDASRRPVWTYSPDGTEAAGFWSDDIRGATATVEVVSVVDNTPLELEIDKLAVSRTPVTPQALTTPDQRAPFASQSAQILGWGKAVVRLRFVGDDGKEYVCTGFLVSRDLLMTNHHCMQSEDEVQSAIADFDFDRPNGAFTSGTFAGLLHASAPLDYAVLRLRKATERTPLPLRAATLAERQALLVVEHPAGEAKQVSILDCRVEQRELPGVSADATDFGHLCDTLGGSSGSPIQDITSGDVVGLHHLGFRDGSPQPVNQGVHMGRIIDDLRASQPDLAKELGIAQE